MTESISSDFVRQVRMALEVLAGGTSMSPTDELSALVGGLTGYGLVIMGNDQQANLDAGDHVEFSGFDGEANGIAVSFGAGQANGLITLQPGIWRMDCWLRGIVSGSTGVCDFQFRNNTAASLFGVAGHLQPTTSAANNSFSVGGCHAVEEIQQVAEIEVRITFETLLIELEESANGGGRATFMRVADLS